MDTVKRIKWDEQLFDANGKPAGFTEDPELGARICAARPGWTHATPPQAERVEPVWKTPVLGI